MRLARLPLVAALLLAVPFACATRQARATTPAAAAHRVLFDDTKAETAGNADWIVSSRMPDPTAQNPNPRTERDWTGALSAWGVALQKTGRYTLRTLPPGGRITFGDSTNALDLSGFDAFVLPEPNVRFSAAEKSAILAFVHAGGGLFLVVDHTGSDRNNDGVDSVRAVDDLMAAGPAGDPFGFTVDALNIARDNPVAARTASDPVLHGPFGTVTGSIIRNGTTATLHPADNPAVRGIVWRTGANQSGTTGAFVVTSRYGTGRVALWGDSSAIDDGTGQPGNRLFDGWDDPAGTDAALGLNATAWLATR